MRPSRCSPPPAAWPPWLRDCALMLGCLPQRLHARRARPADRGWWASGSRRWNTAQIEPTTTWTALTGSHWYGEQSRVVEIVSETAVWYPTGKPPVPIRWVLIRDQEGHFPTQALRLD